MVTEVSLGINQKIGNYHLLEQLYAGSRTLVFRAVKEGESGTVVLKLSKNLYPSFSELLYFRNQYAIAKTIVSPNIIQVYNLESHQNGYVLIMEDFGGISLQEYMKEQSLNIIDCLEIFLKLAESFDALYQYRVLHKDIKSANILINPATKQIKLIDFSIASLLSREVQEIQNPNILEGTLEYISPEQTGRINRGIDYRSDFYSLGVVFFELLTGQLPFQSNDPMELVHCHIARKPPIVHHLNPAVPPTLSNLVQKLMAKSAEDRYQSATGLKHDLNCCLRECLEMGSISAFPLGQRDISDRFQIPEKLYGRQQEVDALLSTFERVSQGSCELMIVTGFSGIGKTTIVNEVQKPIVQKQGYFIKGKYDQLQRSIPFSAVVQAIRDLVEQLLGESDEQLAFWKIKLSNALGENGQVLAEVVPELERIIGSQPAAPHLSGEAAQTRFNVVFQNFIQVFATPEHPLVIFLDDLQWADLGSLRLLERLLIETPIPYLLVIGAYRDNEIFPTHPLTITLENIQRQNIPVNAIVLAPLEQLSINQLVADTLSTSLAMAKPLSELVSTKTQGNPFFITQFLYALYDDQLIVFNHDAGYWQCDLDQIQTLALTDDVVEFMVAQLQKLPAKTQRVLRLAACIGNQFDLTTLATIYERPQMDTASDLWHTLQKGFVVPQNNVYKFFQEQSNHHQAISSEQPFFNGAYRFLHDRIQQAAYALIPDTKKLATHLRIGQLLLKQEFSIETSEMLFEIVNHLNIGAGLLTEQLERDELAQLNLTAGCKAKAATVYEAALSYFRRGIQLLSEQKWQIHYNLTLALHQNALEAAYLIGDYEQMEEWSAIVLKNSRTLLDSMLVYEVRLQRMIAQNQFEQVLPQIKNVLSQLGVNFPETLTLSDIETTFLKTQSLLVNFSFNELRDQPPMVDAKALAAIRIMSTLLGPLYATGSLLFNLVIYKIVCLTLEKGNAPESPMGYAAYAVNLVVIGDIETAYEFGQLALQLLEKPEAKGNRIKTEFVVHNLCRPQKESIRIVAPSLLQGYHLSLENGDPEYAGFYIVHYSVMAFLGSEPLDDLCSALERYSQSLLQRKQEMPYLQFISIRQFILNLLTDTEQPTQLMGPVLDEQMLLPLYHEKKDGLALFLTSLVKLKLSCLFPTHSIYEEEQNCLSRLESCLPAVKGSVMVPISYFYSSLVQLERYLHLSEEEQAKVLSNVAANQAVVKQSACYAPMNYAHQVALVEAEVYRVLNHSLEATECYDRAIAGAKEHGFAQEEALANELAAKFYLNWKKPRIAQEYMIEAYYCYARWGAKTKLTDLTTRYPDLLAPILQANVPSVKVSDTVPLVASSIPSSQSQLSESNVSAALDYASLLKASQFLSSEMNLDRLLSIVLKIVSESAGAQKGILVLKRNERLSVEAVLDMETSNIGVASVPLDESTDVPINLIQTVHRTQEASVIFHAAIHPSLSRDPYIQQHQPKSVLCIPILRHDKSIGVLYLENNLTTGAFTRDRIEILNFLCAQAAISLENARLYQQAQEALEHLKNAQSHIVQAEKMSSLGNLVAGIAHEVNNPINFIHGNLTHLNEYVQDLCNYIEQCRTYSNQIPALENLAQEIDIEFLTEDLQKMVRSMRLGTDRIRQIVLSLRNFSRLDEADWKPVNIHEGIDNTLVILEHRLKPKAERPAIIVAKEYGNLPDVECYAGQLNQVFMNLLANAIDALEEQNQGRSFAEVQANPNKIIIRTLINQDQQVQIHISDNGPGIPEAVQKKIFDPMFTTKPVGKGTGLGLSISRQIIIEKHKGVLTVNSAPGRGSEFIIILPSKRSKIQL